MSRKKRNDQLRSKKDGRNRKKPTDGVTWTERLMDELQSGEESEQPKGKRKGSPESARRLRSDHN
ncbi:hypothetical protein [Salimicrobium flavidum]|uniref:hypothetical protein n=1 Tax=Salimicrobium flavidum TaxID=570947 RepID=UPI000970805C|nr:hypothetical protein [Salimicrobium flavidum]